MNGLSCTQIVGLMEDYCQDCCLPDAFKEIEKELSAPPAELKRLVKISLPTPWPSLCWVQFSTTKYVVTGRNTLSLESVKAQKVVLSGIRAAGGAHLVLISANLLPTKLCEYGPQQEGC